MQPHPESPETDSNVVLPPESKLKNDRIGVHQERLATRQSGNLDDAQGAPRSSADAAR